jgi:pimeloyl-ACP methyl ester carboxylesterase
MVASPTLTHAPNASRARYPDASGVVTRDGVRVAWDRYGPAEPEPDTPTILLLPTWTIIHSRFWKGQIPYLARHFRVVTFDGRGNGRADRPTAPAAYAASEFVADAIAVLDATGTERAVCVSLSMGACYVLRLAADHPERVLGAMLFGPAVGLAPRDPDRDEVPFDEDTGRDEGWARYNAASWRRDWPGFARFFFGEVFSEPHSTKPIDDSVEWALDTDPGTMVSAELAPYFEHEVDGVLLTGREAILEYAGRVQCPAVVVHGTDDRIIPFEAGRALAAAIDATLVGVEGGGHSILARDPVLANLLIRDFVRSVEAAP